MRRRQTVLVDLVSHQCRILADWTQWITLGYTRIDSSDHGVATNKLASQCRCKSRCKSVCSWVWSLSNAGRSLHVLKPSLCLRESLNFPRPLVGSIHERLFLRHLFDSCTWLVSQRMNTVLRYRKLRPRFTKEQTGSGETEAPRIGTREMYLRQPSERRATI